MLNLNSHSSGPLANLSYISGPTAWRSARIASSAPFPLVLPLLNDASYSFSLSARAENSLSPSASLSSRSLLFFNRWSPLLKPLSCVQEGPLPLPPRTRPLPLPRPRLGLLRPAILAEFPKSPCGASSVALNMISSWLRRCG